MKTFYLVDSQASIRQMLAEVLDRRDYSVIGESGDGAKALEEISELKPDVIVTEARLKTHSGPELIRRLKRELPESRFVIFSDERSPIIVKETLKAGAHGYIEKSVTLSELLNSLRIVADGGCFFGFNITEVIRKVVSEPQHAESPQDSLTDREREVLIMIANGNSNKDIAAILGLSVKTVDNHRCSMMRKLNLHNVASITRYAMEHRMVELNFAI
ncbi:response regulator transcription factor [Pelagicoccus sp. SDUM812003]|uniref:response regulator transcription factor n=1 Tax=Pelagicoccus sp. SDUM812003 TaxID=3041267 RepID=UPI00280FD900|nr:response regulator transcription factor [Pelagicoccus sp. SDUM812003]MDQ8201892.1 response regulator transcription factor [Pelagicoccus sp. SDUM812003]